jgi:hypothetical protein
VVVEFLFLCLKKSTMTRKIIFTFCTLLITLSVYSQVTITDLHFLAGTWKVDGKETYEIWETTADNALKGSSYKIKEGKNIVTETLSIKSIDGKIVYEATVANQNEGKGIPFTLNSNFTNGYSFENPGHDFPTKIIYQKISTTELAVQVLGADDKGFTIKFIKQ